MSGHSKWATIKRAKGAADLKRGLTFTKISNAITIAVKRGGKITNPDQNFKLRLAIEAAKEANMPKENIERAIQRAVAKEEGEVTEAVYEGFAPFGISVIVEAITDNSLRTTSEIKSLFSKEGGTFGQPGSVAYQFETKGKINIKKNGKKLDDIFTLAADVGAEDIEEDEEFIVYTESSKLFKVRDSFLAKGIQVSGAQLVRKPTVLMPIADKENYEKVIAFLYKLEELDDVQKVYSNLRRQDEV